MVMFGFDGHCQRGSSVVMCQHRLYLAICPAVASALASVVSSDHLIASANQRAH